MTALITRPSRWRDAATLLTSMLMLSAVALYNRYPLVYTDTDNYLTGTNLGIRSVFYNIFIRPAHLTHTLWTVVFAQSFLVAYLLRLLLREVFAITSQLQFLFIIALLCVLTSLPWYASWLMPDIFTSVMVVGLFMMGFCFRRLRRWEQCFVMGVTLGAAVAHNSNLPIAIGLWLVGLIARIVWRRRAPDTVPHLAIPAMVIVAGVAALVFANYLTYGIASYSPGGYAFELARLQENGPATEFLRDHCATRKYAACAYLDRMPMSAIRFLWASDSLFMKMGFLEPRKEGQEIVAGTIEEHPLEVLRDAVADSINQLGRNRTADGMDSAANSPFPTDAVRSLYPGEFAVYMNSRQNQNEFADMPRLQRLHLDVIAFSVFYCLFITILMARDGQWLPVEFTITVAFAVLFNAFVAGAISDPLDRFGSRVIWMVPLIAIASWRKVLGLPEDR